MSLILRQGVALAAAGLILGLAGAIALARFIGSLLFGITSTDPFTFLSVPVVLLLIALLACGIPARRAGQFQCGEGAPGA